MKYALVHGAPISGQTIDLPIGRHPKNDYCFALKMNGEKQLYLELKDLRTTHGNETETGRTPD